MNRSHFTFRCGLAGVLLAAALPFTMFSAPPNQHVVILVMDGARYTETWGAVNRTNIPCIATNLARRGVVLTNFYTDITSYTNVSPAGGGTETNPGHATLACGNYQDIANNGTEFPYEPTIFQYYRKQYSTPANSTWVVTSKDKLFVLSNCSKIGWTNVYRPTFNCGVNTNGTGGYRTDSATHDVVRSVLTNQHPALLLINYKDPDSMGHANNWPGYVAAVKQTDAYAGQLWDLIQSDPVLKDTTTLFITNDHGRHTSSFIGHGDSCEGCRHLLCVVLGPAFKTNQISGMRRTQPDVARTAADLLGVDMPTATGQVMSELYQQPKITAQPVTTSNQVVLSWPTVPGYNLVVSTNLQPGSWTNSQYTPEQMGSEMKVAVPTSDAKEYYRLKK